MNHSANAIAVIGMSCRFPGCRNVAQYWQKLRDGVECIRTCTDEELLAAGVHPTELEDPHYVKASGPLDDVEYFDAGFFGLSPKDAAIMDPQHRHFYECAWEALEQAAEPPSRFRGAIAVFAGCGMNAYFIHNVLTNPELVRSVGHFLLRHTGNDRDFLPTGVSYKLNLRGPSVAVQTACSTSLVAIHMACQSLLAGECDMALAGGATIFVPHGQGYYYRENEVHSPDGHCRAFDARAAGTVITNGVGVVVLRRLEDALADGDCVQAVIRGSAINNDGAQKVGYLAPSIDGHAAVVAEALGVAGLSADGISYLEAHGTGTAVGDPIEIAALTQAFRRSSQRKQFCPIGSVKTVIGHTDTAAGVASLIKVVESLKHRQIPPSLNFVAPNPAIDFKNSPFVVNDRLHEWTSDGEPRRAGVSSLGVGGTNAHLIVEEGPAGVPSDPARPGQILTLSAKTPTALDTLTRQLAEHLRREPELNFADVAHTLQVGRDAFEYRRVVVADSLSEAAAVLESGDTKRILSGNARKTSPGVVFLFPGGGTQYPNMARRVYECEPVYRQKFDEGLSVVNQYVDFDLRRLIFPEAGQEAAAAEALRQPCASICAIFITEYAMAHQWIAWGIEPVALTGHSLGEYTAACLADVMSLDDALRIVAVRGRLVERAAGAAMLSIPLPEAEVRALLGDDLDLAAINGPQACLVAGMSDALDRLAARLVEREVECRKLHVAGASHCRLLDPLLPEFRDTMASIRLRPPQRPFISNVSGTWATAQDVTDPDYWVRHFRQPVRFADGLAELLRDTDRILLEVGPGQSLGSLARQQSAKPRAVIASIPHPDDKTPSDRFLREALGRCWLAGYDVDWSRLREDEQRQRLALPTYPFERQRYWIEPGKGSHQSEPAGTPLGKRAALDDWFSVPVWQRADLGSSATKLEGSLEWLVFLDPAGVGLKLAERLRQQNQRVVLVREGDTFYRFSDEEYAISPESGRETYDVLLATLAGIGRLPQRIVHLPLLTTDETTRKGSNFFHRNQERGFYSLLFLAQAMSNHELPSDVRLWVVSNGMQAVGNESLSYPDKATVLGPVKVIPHEFPGVTCQSIDFPWGASAGGSRTDGSAPQWLDEITSQLWSELTSGSPDTLIAYRQQVRYVQRYEPVRLQPSHADNGQPQSAFRQRGTYLITGGLGGIGMLVADHLVHNYQARLVLLGREGLPPADEWQDWLARHGEENARSQKIRRLLAWEEAGAEVLVAAADVANVEQLQRVLDQAQRRFGPLHGVIHLAGGLDDAVIASKTIDQIAGVFSSKVYGTLVLLELLCDVPLDFFLLFSSSSAILGPAGQVDYTAANCFLDAIAHQRQAGCSFPIRTINWGIWKDVGKGISLSRQLRGEAADETFIHELVDHPLLHEWLVREPERIVFGTRLDADELWVLNEHRMAGGQAVMPGTGYIEWVRAAAEYVMGTTELEFRDFTFLAPLKVDDGEQREARVTLSRTADGFDFSVSSRSLSAAHSGWQEHAQGHVSAAQERAACACEAAARPSISTAELAALGRDKSGTAGAIRTRQSQFVRFGPRWNCLRAVRFGQHEAWGVVELAAEFAADTERHVLHPALLDLATAFALPLIEGYDQAEVLYVPLGYHRLRVHGRLPSRIVSYVRCSAPQHIQQETATFDIVIADEAGTVLVEVERLTVKRMASTVGFDFDRIEPPRDATQRHTTLTASQQLFLDTFSSGIRADEGMQSLERILADDSLPQVIASPVNISAWLAKTHEASASAATDSHVKFERPTLASQFEAPRDELERQLADIWGDLLGVDQIGIHDNFFELGGHSLIAVRLFSRIKKAWQIEYPISVLFEAPTIASCAELLRAELGTDVDAARSGSTAATKQPAHRYLVPLHLAPGSEVPPFFLIAGMAGNVLNLRHLGIQLGKDQPVYAVQARGLYGDDEPHETFEEMAAAYLQEIRSIQPEGPYYLGGYSGGGISAYEMAQQLLAEGEQVGIIVMLDSIPPRIPQPTWRDRCQMQWQNLRREGLAYFSTWARNRWEWEQRKRRVVVRELTPAEFRSDRILAAFRRALQRYQVRPYPGKVHLFRPPLDAFYQLAGGRVINRQRTVMDPQNHWSEFVTGGIEVHVVPGKHFSMVLEPNVRVLAEKLRSCLAEARTSARPRPSTLVKESSHVRDLSLAGHR